MSEIGRKGGEHSQGGGSMEEDNESGSERGGSHRNSMRGGTPDQHAEAGRQSHKNQGQSEERNQGHSQKAVRTIVSLTRAMAKKLVAIHQSNMLRQAGKVTKTADLFRQSAD
jgi:general stress protein YciG